MSVPFCFFVGCKSALVLSSLFISRFIHFKVFLASMVLADTYLFSCFLIRRLNHQHFKIPSLLTKGQECVKLRNFFGSKRFIVQF